MKNILRTILVPHDLSNHANRALKIAAHLAGPHGRLIVLHVANRYGNALVQKSALEGAGLRLEQVIARTLGGRNELTIDCRVVPGDPYAQITQVARDADSIVMCTAGRTGLSHLVIGSVAEKVVRHAPVSVLTFRPTAAIGRRTRSNQVARVLNHGRAARRTRRTGEHAAPPRGARSGTASG